VDSPHGPEKSAEREVVPPKPVELQKSAEFESDEAVENEEPLQKRDRAAVELALDVKSLTPHEAARELELALRRLPCEDARSRLEAFLCAMALVVELVKVFLGSNPAGIFIQRDIGAHIETVTRVNAGCGKLNVQELVYAERELARDDATKALLFMKRALLFTLLMIAHMTAREHSHRTIADSARAAYSAVYAAVHPMWLRPTIGLVLNATPSKRWVYEQLQPPDCAPDSAVARNALRAVARTGLPHVSALANFFLLTGLETQASLAPEILELEVCSDSDPDL